MPADVIELLPRFDPESDKAERRFDGMLDRIRSLQEELARLGPKRAELERHFIENDLVIRSGPRRGQPLSVAGRRRRLHALLRIERSYDRVAAEEERLMNHLAVLQAALDEWELEKNETELPGERAERNHEGARPPRLSLQFANEPSADYPVPRRRHRLTPNALVAKPQASNAPWWAHGPIESVWEDLRARIARLPTRLNEYGYDPFGYQPTSALPMLLPMAFFYREWFRVDARGLENVPPGGVLLIANHGGNTFAYDGAMLATAMFLDAEPPRIVRGMAEYYLPTIPFFNTLMTRMGSVVGRPENCVELLNNGEAVMVFPEGERGFVKPYSKAYQLQRFGLGFLRLALETETPIVPVGIVGSEEQSPGLARVQWLAKLVGAPVAPITLTFPWLGPLGFLPLPVKFHMRFGKPLHFRGDPNDDDASMQKHVDVVKEAISGLIQEGLSARKTWFT